MYFCISNVLSMKNDKCKKKVIIIGPAHPYRGGLAAFNERLGVEYHSQGYDVELYTFTLQYPSFLFPGKTQFSESLPPDNLVIHRKINSCNPFNWHKIAKEIKGKNADIVIFAYWMAFFAPCYGYIARILKQNKNTRRIALVHNMIPHEPNILDKILPRFFVKNIDAFISLSKSVVEDINTFDKYDKPKCYSPHPIYEHYGEKIDRKEAIKQLNLDENADYVLFFGLVRAYKGLDLLLEAFGESIIKEKNIKLIIAGEFYDNPELYIKQIEDLGISDKVVIFNKYIADNEVNKFFSAASLIAQPYKSATQSGVSQVAYHFEKPMCVTNVGGLAEVVPDGNVGYVVKPDAKSIAAAIDDFFSNGRENEFASNISIEKQKYKWSRFVESIEELYNEVKESSKK